MNNGEIALRAHACSTKQSKSVAWAKTQQTTSITCDQFMNYVLIY